MADNNTSTASPQDLGDLIDNSWKNNIRWIIFVLYLTTAIYGVTSWRVLKKFRHFRNYVLLSAIIVKFIYAFIYFIIDKLTNKFIQNVTLAFLKRIVEMYLVLSYHCWLLVLCYIFYVDFVKVFNLDIRRRYLKSSLFASGLPFISILLLCVPGLYVNEFVSRTRTGLEIVNVVIMSVLLMPVVINFVIYIRVLYSLFRVSEATVNTTINKWRRFYIATLIFVLSNVIWLPFVTSIFGVHIPLAIVVIMELGGMINIVALPVYFIILKSNRELWREFLDKRSKQKSLEMK